MNRDDIQKLLGGYATGTLTPEEQQALFEAALDDQELFDTLAREQALRDLLRDPAAKTHLLAALDRRTPRWYEQIFRGWRPLAAAVAMAGVGAIAVVVWQNGRPPQRVLIARNSPPPAAASPASNARADAGAVATPPAAAAANPTPEPSAIRDTNASALRDKDAPSGRLAKDSPAKALVAAESVAEDDRRAKEKYDRGTKEKQLAQAPRRFEVADSATEARSASKGAAVPPLPPNTVATGFRDGTLPGGVSGIPTAPQPVAEPKAPAFRSTTGGATGGAVGGVLGGLVGGKPGTPPPPPAPVPPPKAEAQPTQSAQSQAVPAESAASQSKLSQSGASQSGQQGQQGGQQAPSPSAQSQFGRAQQSTPSQLDRARRTQPPAAAGTVEVTAAAASVDALASQDVKSLFYGDLTDSLNAPGARGGAAGRGAYSSTQPAPPDQALKKVVQQPEKTQSERQAVAVNAVAANSRAPAHVLNLGVRYSLLRKTAAGGFEPVDPGSVKTGDTLKLELMPNSAGLLSVRGRNSDSPWRDVMSRSVEASKTYTTEALKSGDKELQVTLIRRPVAPTGVSLGDDSSLVSQQSTTEPATYVVTGPASQQLRFVITLHYQ